MPNLISNRSNRVLRSFGLLSIAVVMAACSGAPQDAEHAGESREAIGAPITPPSTPRPADDDGVVLDQIAAARAQIAALGLPTSLVSFAYDAPIASDAQVTSVQSDIGGVHAVVPRFDGSSPASFSTSTVADRMAVRAADETQLDVSGNLQAQVYPLIKTGQKTLDLTWQNTDGTQFHSKCVYDATGVVYDNMLSNLVVVDAGPAPADSTTAPPSVGIHPIFEPPTPVTTDSLDSSLNPAAESSSAAAAKRYSFTARAVDTTIKWVWGGTRGKIIVDHSILWNGSNTIYDQSTSTSYYMSLGSAQAQAKNTVLKTNAYAKIAWGYAWATPTADFSIKFDAKKGDVGGSFDVSLKGVGSKGGGDGHHTIYLP